MKKSGAIPSLSFIFGTYHKYVHELEMFELQEVAIPMIFTRFDFIKLGLINYLLPFFLKIIDWIKFGIIRNPIISRLI